MPIYFDNNATTPVNQEVVDAMIPFLRNHYGNPSSAYSIGVESNKAITEARQQLANLLNMSPSGIIFTSSGSESDNMAIKSVARHYKGIKNTIISTSIEHHAVLHSLETLKESGFNIIHLNPNEKGQVEVNDLIKILNSEIGKDVFLVSVMAANNETGVCQPINEIGKILEDKNIVFHVDCVQSIGSKGKPKYGDLISISGHKVNAPKGIGALCISDNFENKFGFSLSPFIDGGKQEMGLRGGTENVPYIVGYAKAMTIFRNNADKYNSHTSMLRNHLKEFIKKNINDVKFNTQENIDTLSNTLNVSFKGIDGAALLMYLNEFDICISTGSACNTGSPKPSHVLKAMGLTDEEAFSSIRISFGLQNTFEELEYFEEILIKGIIHLRRISGYKN